MPIISLASLFFLLFHYSPPKEKVASIKMCQSERDQYSSSLSGPFEYGYPQYDSALSRENDPTRYDPIRARQREVEEEAKKKHEEEKLNEAAACAQKRLEAIDLSQPTAGVTEEQLAVLRAKYMTPVAGHVDVDGQPVVFDVLASSKERIAITRSSSMKLLFDRVSTPKGAFLFDNDRLTNRRVFQLSPEVDPSILCVFDDRGQLYRVISFEEKVRLEKMHQQYDNSVAQRQLRKESPFGTTFTSMPPRPHNHVRTYVSPPTNTSGLIPGGRYF